MKPPHVLPDDVAGSPDLPPSVTRLIKRQRVMIATAAAATALSLVGLAASVFVKSPAQQAAEQAPPKPSVLTAPVVRKVLHGSLTLRGTVAATMSESVPVVTPATAEVAVVSRTPHAVGDSLSPGNVLIEVPGRPVIVLPGKVPMYRDLSPGDTGPDVVQLQKALRSLGYAVRDSTGVFGSSTQRALRHLYTARGYEPISATPATTPTPLTASSPTASATPTVTSPMGVQAPRGELAFVPSFPVLVGTLAGAVGTLLSQSTGSLATLYAGGLSVRCLVPSGQREPLKKGQSATILDETANRSAHGAVASIGVLTSSTPATSGSGGDGMGQAGAGVPRYPLTVKPRQALDRSWLGVDVVVTIATNSTKSAVLVVPTSAITQGVDGSTSVTVRTPDGTRHVVPVVTGATANGEVQVSPAEGKSSLKPGDAVVTGQ